MFQVNTMVLIIMVVLVTYRVHADLSISTSTPTPCYGDVVTLGCHHPEVASNRGRYFTTTPQWRENGVVITPSTGIYLQTDTSEDFTYTTLNINITVDHFRNKSFNYSCLLVLAENGRPSGEVETSENVTVDPVELTSPKVTNMDPLEFSITVRWTPQPCAVRYSVSWMYTNDGGTTTTGSGVSDQVTNYTIPTSVQGVYTVSVQAVDGVGNVGQATSEVVRSTYPRPTADAPPCEDRSLVLTCLVSGLHNDRRSHFMWIDRNGPLDTSDQFSITGAQLMIANVSAISDEEDKAIRCCEVLNNGIVGTGEEYMVELLAQPGSPEVTITTTDSTITLTWNTALHCFESEMFAFVVIWNEIGSGTSTNVTTSSSPYTISGLQPGTSYQISVQGVGGSGVVGGKRVLNATTSTETPTGGGDLTTVVVIAAVIGVFSVIILVAVVITIILVAVHCAKILVQGVPDPRSSAHDPIPPASSNLYCSRLSGTCCYTTVDFESGTPTPIPPPPVEGVTYAEPVAVGEEDINEHKTESELPTKQQHNNVGYNKPKQVTGFPIGLPILNQPTILEDQANDDSESEDLLTPEQVVDSSPMVLPEYPPPTKTTPPPDYQGGYSAVTSNDSKTHDDQFRSPPGDTIVSSQFLNPMASDSIISGSTDLSPVNQPPTQFSGQTCGFHGCFKTGQTPSQRQQNLGMWTGNKAESIQHMQQRNKMPYIVHRCNGQLNSSKQLFTTVERCCWCDQG